MTMGLWLMVLTCFNHLEKYEFVNWDYYSKYMEKKCSKPPTRTSIFLLLHRLLLDYNQTGWCPPNYVPWFIAPSI